MAKRRGAGDSDGDDTAAGGRKRRGSGAGGDLFDQAEEVQQIDAISLREAAQERYLNYSLSVITSRALPDVRDGLKPVQRRILYAMDQLGIGAESKPRKCAFVCGNVTGNFHPHGETSVYDALVRLAQPWALRETLVDGIGNFGSIDGDNAAAMRYTECRLTPIAVEILRDLGTRIVPYKPNYDGTRQEPVVLPSRMPNMLVNGATGIAVGMATNIPPHNLGEVCRALLKLLKDPEIKDYQLVANDAVQGPDFPTGGQLINTKDELREIYRTGQGSLKLRGTTQMGTPTKSGSKLMHITSIPYGVNKSVLVERIAEIVLSSKMPLIEDVRDVSTEEIRIDLQLRKDADEAKVLAYLFKQTPLQTNFNVNLTCLVPTENPEVGRPERLGLKEVLWHFLHFRLHVVTARLQTELDGLQRRMHILQGFVLIFDALDEIIRIIRASEGKADAAQRIMKRFPQAKGGLDEEQTDAILELKLYRLAKLEINLIQDELKEKSKRAHEIQKLLKENTDDTNSSGRWAIVRQEIEGLIEAYGKQKNSNRRTQIITVEEESEYTRRGFHCCRGLPRAADCRWLGETAEADCRPLQESPARRGSGAGLRGRFHPGDAGPVFLLWSLLHRPLHRYSRLDRTRRAHPKAVQNERRRENRGRHFLGSAGHRQYRRRSQASRLLSRSACFCGDQQWFCPAFWIATVCRTLDPLR